MIFPAKVARPLQGYTKIAPASCPSGSGDEIGRVGARFLARRFRGEPAEQRQELVELVGGCTFISRQHALDHAPAQYGMALLIGGEAHLVDNLERCAEGE